MCVTSHLLLARFPLTFTEDVLIRKEKTLRGNPHEYNVMCKLFRLAGRLFDVKKTTPSFRFVTVTA